MRRFIVRVAACPKARCVVGGATVTRWLVSYESGRHITVMARDSVDARRMGALMWPRDSVVEVRVW